MDQEQFQISFERSGGFTGTSTRIEIDSGDLVPGEAEELNQLILRSEFFEAVTFNSNILNMPDQFQYKITIEQTGRTRTLELNDGSLPDLFRPLINYLVGVARKHRRT